MLNSKKVNKTTGANFVDDANISKENAAAPLAQCKQVHIIKAKRWQQALIDIIWMTSWLF